MKLPNFLEDAVLVGMRQKMNAPLASAFLSRFTYESLNKEELELLGREGLEINLDEISIEPDGTLSIKGQRILVHIRDVTARGRQFSLPRYHVVYCDKLDEMRTNNRWGRYVASQSTIGVFHINRINEGKSVSASQEKLDICQYCLGKLNWEQFHHTLPGEVRKNIVQNFTAERFFEKYPKNLLPVQPKYSVEDAPLNDYPSNWSAISELYKSVRLFQCECCNIILKKELRRYLHLHHVNGQKNDCSAENLRLLCIECHAKEPLHSHMQVLDEYKRFTKEIRPSLKAGE